MSKEDLIRAAQKEVLETYRKEFEQLSASFRDLDTKAQGAAAIAGVFLAATLTYLNRPDFSGTDLIDALMLFALLGLVCAVIFSLLALRIRRIAGQPSGKDLEKLLTALARSPTDEDLLLRLSYFYGDAAKLWEGCVKERRATNEGKATHIWSAQRSLTVTALAIAGLILRIILNS